MTPTPSANRATRFLWLENIQAHGADPVHVQVSGVVAQPAVGPDEGQIGVEQQIKGCQVGLELGCR